jgi:hypothetical protein
MATSKHGSNLCLFELTGPRIQAQEVPLQPQVGWYWKKCRHTHTYTYISYAFDFLWFLNKGLDRTSICSIKNTFGPFINTYIKRTISCMCVRMIWMHMLRSYHWRHSAGPLRQASGCRGAQDGAKLVCWIRPANLNSRYRGLTMINPWFIFTGVPVLKGFLSLIVWGCSGGSP